MKKIGTKIEEENFRDDIGKNYIDRVFRDSIPTWEDHLSPIILDDVQGMLDLASWERHFKQKGIKTRRVFVPPRKIGGVKTKRDKVTLEVYQRWYRS